MKPLRIASSLIAKTEFSKDTKIVTVGYLIRISANLDSSKTRFANYSVRRYTTRNKMNAYQRTVDLLINGETRTYNTTLLRDRCGCVACYNALTRQRSSLYNQLTQDAFVVKDAQVGNTEVSIRWGDDHLTTLQIENLVDDSANRIFDRISKITWHRKRLEHSGIYKTTSISLSTKSGVAQLARNLYIYGVAMVTDVDATVEATVEVAKKLSVIHDTFYGPYWCFGTANQANIDSPEFADTAYSNIPLGPHTDGTYFLHPPAIQVFHCLKNECVGGETLLVDGHLVVQKLKMEYPNDYELLCNYRVEHRYADEDRLISAEDRVIKIDPKNPDSHPLRIRFNPYDRADQTPQKKLAHFYAAYHKFHDIINDPLNSYWLRLEPGQVLFIDNWRILHGRAGFKGQRQICGCYLQRDDWMSKLQIN